MPQMIVPFQEFCAEHGGKPLRLRGQLLFQDGASADLNDMVRHAPPDNPYDRLHLQRLFAVEIERRRVEEFRRLQAALQGGEHFRWPADLPAGPTDPLAALAMLKDLAEKAHARVVKIDQELAATPEAQRRQQALAYEEEMARAEEQRAVKLATAASQIKLNF